MAKEYLGATTLARLLMPRGLKEVTDNHAKLTVERVKARMVLETNRPDFLGPILKNQDEKAGGMTKPELMGITNLLIIAGSETTATLLSGVTYHLLRNLRFMEKLVAEVRSKFTSEDQINLTSAQASIYVDRIRRSLAYLPSFSHWTSPCCS
jgi:cytochrome P450